MLIHCPYCDESRDEQEFGYAGEAHIKRPEKPLELSDRAWGEYLFFRSNPRGNHREMWVHAAGCRKYFNVERNTETYEIRGSYRIGDALPEDGQ